MISHQTPKIFQTSHLIASWDNCGTSRYSGPCPARQPTAAEDAEDQRDDMLVALAKQLKRRGK